MKNIQDNFYNLGNDFFSLCGHKCRFDVIGKLSSNGNSQKALIVNPIYDEPIYYAFSSNGGLCKTTEFGSVQTENLLEAFISLPPNNAKSALQFFENNGFLFNLPSATHTEINLHQLTNIINRIKAVALLMTELESPLLNYNQILTLTLYLLLGMPVELQLTEKQYYKSFRHSLFTYLDSQLNSGSFGIDDEYITENNIDYYLIQDSIYPAFYKLSVDEYEDIANGETFSYNYPGINDTLYKKLTIAYKQAKTLPKFSRLLVEFLFHLMHSNGVIKQVSFDNGVELYNHASINLDSNMKKALIPISKGILSAEINYNVSKMKPIFYATTLTPSWKAPNLLTALYFSLFYTKPDSDIYRKCSNPSCSNYFLVKTSNSRKKYCCDKCRNANNQRDFRKRVKKNTGNSSN